jgi:argininosuccinate lyase
MTDGPLFTVGVFASIFDDAGRLLCVRQNYGPRRWTMPGGRLERGESPVAGVIREVKEETGYIVEVRAFLGVYHAQFKDDVVLSFECAIIGEEPWAPNDEIAERRFCAADDLPQPMGNATLARAKDAFARTRSVLRIIETDIGP